MMIPIYVGATNDASHLKKQRSNRYLIVATPYVDIFTRLYVQWFEYGFAKNAFVNSLTYIPTHVRCCVPTHVRSCSIKQCACVVCVYKIISLKFPRCAMRHTVSVTQFTSISHYFELDVTLPQGFMTI